MKAWSNIQISPEDPEIIEINNLEKNLGKLSDKVCQIRELITRFEVCHFKYQQHLRKIKMFNIGRNEALACFEKWKNTADKKIY